MIAELQTVGASSEKFARNGLGQSKAAGGVLSAILTEGLLGPSSEVFVPTTSEGR